MPQSKRQSRARITNRKTFQAAIWAALEPYVRKLIDEDAAWRKSVRERDPHGKHPRPLQVRDVRRDDLLLHVFQAYLEVTTSFDRLSNIPFYMRHFPPAVSKKVTRPVWIRYHIENYLHEGYIFQNRVEAFFKLLRRSYRKQTYSTELNEQCDLLVGALKKGFAGVVRTRGRHVHESRFEDPSLRTLEAIEFLFLFKSKSAREYTEWFREVRDEKMFWMMHNNATIKKWLDVGGKVLGKLLFMEDGTFRFPSPPQMSSPLPPTTQT